MSTEVFAWNVSYETNYGSKEETQTKVDEFVKTLETNLQSYMEKDGNDFDVKEWFPYDLSIDGLYDQEELNKIFDPYDYYYEEGHIPTNGLNILSDGSISWDTNSEDHNFWEYYLGIILFGVIGKGEGVIREEYWGSKDGSSLTRSKFSKGGSIQ